VALDDRNCWDGGSMLLSSWQVQSFLADSDQFALLVAALGHVPWSLNRQAGTKKVGAEKS